MSTAVELAQIQALDAMIERCLDCKDGGRSLYPNPPSLIPLAALRACAEWISRNMPTSFASMPEARRKRYLLNQILLNFLYSRWPDLIIDKNDVCKVTMYFGDESYVLHLEPAFASGTIGDDGYWDLIWEAQHGAWAEHEIKRATAQP